MLIQFVVENYLSFRKREVFSMRASKNVSRNAGPADLVQNTDILRCAALYGANAAGKSNFVRALDFARSMVLEGTKEGQDIDVHPFQLSKETRDAPVILEIYVRAMSGKIYGYGFSATRRAIQREWLTEVRDGSERLVFEREVGKFHFAARGKNLAYLRNIQVGVRDNQLFLHLARLLKIESFPIAIREVVEWFGSCLQIIQPHTQYGVLVPMLSAFDSFRQFMGAVLRQADTGINGLHLQERRLGQSLEGVAKGRLDLLKFGEKLVVMDTEQGRICYIRDASDWVELSLRFTHRTESGEADLQLENESDGTIRLLDLAPILYSG